MDCRNTEIADIQFSHMPVLLQRVVDWVGDLVLAVLQHTEWLVACVKKHISSLVMTCRLVDFLFRNCGRAKYQPIQLLLAHISTKMYVRPCLRRAQYELDTPARTLNFLTRCKNEGRTQTRALDNLIALSDCTESPNRFNSAALHHEMSHFKTTGACTPR